MDSFIYDWNLRDDVGSSALGGFELFDETLRDGIQSPSVYQPSFDEKLEIVTDMEKIGIEAADLGYPGSSIYARDDAIRLVNFIHEQNYDLKIAFAGRMHSNDLNAIFEVSQRTGRQVECYIFIGVSPIRQYVEGWDLCAILEKIRFAERQCRENNLPMVLVLEDATRCTPELLKQIYQEAIERKIERLVLCDTVGHSTPEGVVTLVTWTRQIFEEESYDMLLDWHGHNDRGFGLSNAITALESGCDRIHGTALGIGERVGNTSIDQLLINLYLNGCRQYRVSYVKEYCHHVAASTGVTIPPNYPAIGADAFKTTAGVHAAAILKAYSLDNQDILDAVYSGVPASLIGREQLVGIDNSSGESNVILWLKKNGFDATKADVRRILEVAKQAKSALQDHEIRTLLSMDNLAASTQR